MTWPTKDEVWLKGMREGWVSKQKAWPTRLSIARGWCDSSGLLYNYLQLSVPPVLLSRCAGACASRPLVSRGPIPGCMPFIYGIGPLACIMAGTPTPQTAGKVSACGPSTLFSPPFMSLPISTYYGRAVEASHWSRPCPCLPCPSPLLSKALPCTVFHVHTLVCVGPPYPQPSSSS